MLQGSGEKSLNSLFIMAKEDFPRKESSWVSQQIKALTMIWVLISHDIDTHFPLSLHSIMDFFMF